MVATRAGPHWELAKEEADRLGYRAARVEQKWGGLLDKYGEELALVGCAAAVLYPRLVVEGEKRQGKPVNVQVVEAPVEGT